MHVASAEQGQDDCWQWGVGGGFREGKDLRHELQRGRLGFGWEPQPLSKLLNISEAVSSFIKTSRGHCENEMWLTGLWPITEICCSGLAPLTVTAVVLFNLSFDQVRSSK